VKMRVKMGWRLVVVVSFFGDIGSTVGSAGNNRITAASQSAAKATAESADAEVAEVAIPLAAAVAAAASTIAAAAAGYAATTTFAITTAGRLHRTIRNKPLWNNV